MTQTKISLTVDMEDALRCIKDRMFETVDALNCITAEQLKYAIEAVEQADHNQGDIRHALIYLDNFRIGLVKIDNRVAEYMSILEGYHNTINPTSSEVETGPVLSAGIRNALDSLEGINE